MQPHWAEDAHPDDYNLENEFHNQELKFRRIALPRLVVHMNTIKTRCDNKLPLQGVVMIWMNCRLYMWTVVRYKYVIAQFNAKRQTMLIFTKWCLIKCLSQIGTALITTWCKTTWSNNPITLWTSTQWQTSETIENKLQNKSNLTKMTNDQS